MLSFLLLDHIVLCYRPLRSLFLISALVVLPLLSLLWWLQLRRKSRPGNFAKDPSKLTVCIVLGSGGHTTEMLRLVEALGPAYRRRVYLVAETDGMSEKKLLESEGRKGGGDFEIWRIPRSREVRQSYPSAVLSTLLSVLACLPLLWRLRPDLVLCNGPGTCVPICGIAYLMDLLCVKFSRVVFVESVCRTETLSLSGELLYYLRLADAVLVQWPRQKERFERTEFIGKL